MGDSDSCVRSDLSDAPSVSAGWYGRVLVVQVPVAQVGHFAGGLCPKSVHLLLEVVDIEVK
jgi:hypothetical protein